MAKKAVIIGAGPAGLTAAYKLLKETDILPVIYEESDCVGGISRTAEYHGNRIDIGGHRFFSKDEEVNALWGELMPVQGEPAQDDKLLGREKDLMPGGPDPETDERVMLIRDRVSRIYFLKKFFDYPLSLKAKTFANMGFSRTMQAGFGYLAAAVHKRKENSLEDFYINRFGKPLYEMFFEDYTQKLWGVHPSDIAPDWGRQRVKGVSLPKAVASAITRPFRRGETETSLIEQYYYPKRGPGQYWETMAAEIVDMGGEINFGSRVSGVSCGDGRIDAITVDGPDGEETAEGDYFLSSMPVKDLVAAMGGAPDEKVRDAAAGLPYRDFMTVGLLLNKLKIKNETNIKTVGNIVPDCWIYIQERGVKLGRLQIFNNWSPYMLADPLNTVWIGLEYFCKEGDEMWEMPDDKFIAFASDELEQIGVIDKADVLDAVRIKVKKAYPAYFGTYSDFGSIRGFLDGYANLFCIGRNGQHRYNNMDHSMLTAMRAVDAIRRGETDKSAVWQVNTEQEYHEEKR
jgi:protoporphyrinogen oxidase